MAATGSLYETEAEVTFEWKIEDFFSLSAETGRHYDSPLFYFSGIAWEIWIYPNGETTEEAEWMGLYLKRFSTGYPVNMNYSLSFKTIDGKKDPTLSNKTNAFNKKHQGWGMKKFMSKAALMKRKSDLIPSGTLTVICNLKNNQRYNIERSMSSRDKEIIDMLREILIKSKRTDFIVKVDGESFGTHRMILEARSPVMAAMFNHDTKKNKSGEISIIDVDKTTMRSLLTYMYTGDMDAPTTANVLPLYAAAEKYDVKGIKGICSDFIVRNLSEDWVCDVIKFANLCQDEEIERHAKEFFKKNARKILKTENWKTFAKENHDISVDLLGSVVAALLPEE